MKLTLIVLLALMPAMSAGWSWGGFKLWSWPFLWGSSRNYYYGRQCICASTSTSLDDKMELLGRDNDHDNNGLVTYDDFYYDITERFDKNNDKLLSERECIDQFRCRYGDTEQTAQYRCALIMGGETTVDVTNYNIPPFIEGVPLEQFVQNNRAIYEQFFTNRCVNRQITVEEKLTLNAANNDFNKDGLVTSQDLEYDLTNFYDANKNGEVDKGEFVARWTCNYADTGDYARYMWDMLSQGNLAVRNDAFNIPPYDTGVPIEEFKANNRGNYETYRNRDASNYIQYRP